MKKWVWIIFFLNLAVRLCLLNWNAAEYTDGIRWMTGIDRVRGSPIPPIYPGSIVAFSFIFGDREVSAKLVSILFGSLTVFPLFALGRRVYGERSGLYAILLYTVSPMILRWSIRVMGEATYTFPTVLGLWLFVEYFHSKKLRYVIFCPMACGLAPLAHVPGQVLLPVSVFLYFYFAIRRIVLSLRRSPVWKKLLKTLSLIIVVFPLSFSTWIFWVIWERYITRSTVYNQSMETSLLSLSRRFWVWLQEYALIYPYILTYPLALFFLIGLVRSFLPINRKSTRKIWGGVFLFYFLIIFAGVVANKWWTPRYLYSLFPLSIVIAAFGIETFRWKIKKIRVSVIILALCLLFSTGFSIVALRYSRDSFGDVKRTALFLRDHLKKGRVFSDEILKTGWWAKRPLIAYSKNNKRRLRPNDYVVLHSWGGTNIPLELAYLRRRFDIEIIHEEKAEVIPILADDILSRGANAPVVAHHRFEKQKFLALVIKLLKEKGERDVELSEGLTIYEGMLTLTAREVGHNVQTWKIKPERKRSDDIVLKIAHAAHGMMGTFRMVAYADTNNDGVPDKLIARSPFLEVKEAGSWSTWTFHAEEEVIFVGNMWYDSSKVYYDNGSWPNEVLEDTMFYSNSGDIPTLQVAPKLTNMLVSFENQTEAKTE